MRGEAVAFAAVGLILAGLPEAAHAGAWAQPAGHAYAKLSGIFYGADEIYNDMGVRAPMGMDANSFDGRQAFFYVEYGLLERLTLVSQVNFGVLTDEDRFARSETTGLGDWEIGAKYQAIDGPVVVAPQVLVKLPTGYHTDYVPPLGTGEVDLEARLLVSRSLYPRPVYVGIDGGYRVRGGPFSNQLSWGVELGATPHARVFAKLFAGGTNSLTSGDGADLGVVGGSTQVSEGDFTKAGINGAVEIAGGLWVDVLVERVVDGENIGAGTSWGLGLSVSR